MPAPTKFLIRLAWAALLLGNEAAWTQQLPDQALTLESLPRPGTPPPERGTVVPSQVERWRKEGQALEYGEGVERDAVKAA